MSYLDTTLTPAAGYSYVNNKQVYDVIAAQLVANGNWTLVDTVDYVGSINTFRSFVWRCNAAGSGLPSDFFVVFRVSFSNATAEWVQTNSNVGSASYSASGVLAFVAEGYNSGTKVLSKYAPTGSSSALTPASDRTCSATWTLTAAIPSAATGAPYAAFMGTSTTVTSFRFLLTVTSKVIIAACTSPITAQVYIGVMETLLSPSDDPMPVIIVGTNDSYTSGTSTSSVARNASSTRHPKVPIASTTGLFLFSTLPFHSGSNVPYIAGYPYTIPAASNQAGVVGDPTNLNYSMYLGGAPVSKIPFSTSGSGYNGATKGGLRGFLSHMRAGTLATHSLGDTFNVDGVAYAGLGTSANGLLDTTA